MTWYASHIIAENNPRVLSTLLSDRRTQDHVYVIDSLKRFERTEQVPYAITFSDPPETLRRDTTHSPAFPTSGLVFVREVSGHDDSEDDHREWFGDDALTTPLDASIQLVLPPEEELAVGGVLRYCKHLARQTDSTVCYFATAFWGGECESAQGYVFTGSEEFHYTIENPTSVTVHCSRSPTRRRSIFGGDVLTLCLLHFDVLLPSGHFVPHERGFPWSDFRYR